MDERLQTPQKVWAFIFFLTLLLHLAALQLRLAWKASPAARSAPQVQLEELSPERLERIRDQWNKKLLITPDAKSPADSAVADKDVKDARYFSDRNIRVEREQKGKSSSTRIGKGESGTDARPAATPRQQAPKAPLALKDIGLPMKLTPNVPAAESPGESAPARSGSRTPGGPQAVEEPDLPEGSETLLNAQQSIYYSFFARLREAIAPLWESLARQATDSLRLPPGDYRTAVDVWMDAEGNLLDVQFLQRSGIDPLDGAVNDAWRRLRRFPNPPRALLDGQQRIRTRWAFVFTVDQGGIRVEPPRRLFDQ